MGLGAQEWRGRLLNQRPVIDILDGFLQWLARSREWPLLQMVRPIPYSIVSVGPKHSENHLFLGSIARTTPHSSYKEPCCGVDI